MMNDKTEQKTEQVTEQVAEEKTEQSVANKADSENMQDQLGSWQTKIDEAKHHLKTAAEEIGKAFEKLFKKGPSAEEEK